jgi:Rad3-related DNA helicase
MPASRRLSAVAAGLVILLLLLTAAAIAVAIGMANSESIEKDTLWYEIGKLVAQAGILTGFGALLTLLVHEFQHDQEESHKRIAAASQRLADRHAWFRDFATRLTDAYGDVKQSRRRLQWALQTTEGATSVSTAIYEKQLKRLSAIQADFESLLTLVETYLQEDDPARSINTSLRDIIDRLSKLISERKKLPPLPPGEERHVSLETREVMRGFTAESEDKSGEFFGPQGFEGVKKSYKQALKGTLDELRRPQASTSTQKRSWWPTGR